MVSPNFDELRSLASSLPFDAMDNAISRHEARVDIVELLMLMALDKRDQRGGLKWGELSDELAHEFPGLEVNERQLQDFCRRHVYPSLYIPKNSVVAALVERGSGLDHVSDMLDMEDKLADAFDKAAADMNKVEYDRDGVPHRIGSSPGEVASLARARIKMQENLIKERERYGLIPKGPANTQVNVGVQVNMDGAMQNAMGRRKRPDPGVYDAD